MDQTKEPRTAHVTPEINKGQNTICTWECIIVMDKINFFDLLLLWISGHCGCVELVEYIPFDYLHIAFGVLTK